MTWIDDEDLPKTFDHTWERICVDGDNYYLSRPLHNGAAYRRDLLITFKDPKPADVQVGDLVRLNGARHVLELRRPTVTTVLLAGVAPFDMGIEASS